MCKWFAGATVVDETGVAYESEGRGGGGLDPGHFIVVAGFTARDGSGRPGPAEASWRVRPGDGIVGINGEPLPDNATFNDFARLVREANWPLTLHTVRAERSRAHPSDAHVSAQICRRARTF